MCKFCKGIFSTLYNVFQLNFGILLLLESSFREFRFLRLHQKLVYRWFPIGAILVDIAKHVHNTTAQEFDTETFYKCR